MGADCNLQEGVSLGSGGRCGKLTAMSSDTEAACFHGVSVMVLELGVSGLSVMAMRRLIM